MSASHFFALSLATASPTASLAGPDPERGAYLVQIMDCTFCHTPLGEDGEPDEDRRLSGGTIGFEIPGQGVFWPPNLTSDVTGLAAWTDDEIADAIRGGLRPDGRELAPAMPWIAYSGLTDADVDDLVAYLRTLAPVSNEVPGPLPGAAEAKAPYYTVVTPKRVSG